MAVGHVPRMISRVKVPLGALFLLAVLPVSCATPAAVSSSAPSPTVPVATPAVTTSAPSAAPSQGLVFAASECTKTTATTRQVIERYFALSTSNNADAVIDCFAKVWRDKNNVNPSFAESAARWSQTGPASALAITFLDTVNGCDRFSVGVTMPNQRVAPFFTVGPEGGMPRIFETGTALVNPQIATTTCK